MQKVFKTLILGLTALLITTISTSFINAAIPVPNINTNAAIAVPQPTEFPIPTLYNNDATAGTTITKSNFSDLTTSNQNFPAINYLNSNNIIQGYPDGTVGASKSINRAEFTKIILESKDKITEGGIEIKYDPAYSFPDIKPSDWFAKYVSTAKKRGILQGYPDGYFHPERNINYVESSKIVTNTFEIEEQSLNNEADRPVYQSESSDDWYYPFLKRAETTNTFFIPAGSSTYNFDLSKPITRGTAFENLYRTIIIKKDDRRFFPDYKLEFADYQVAADFAAGEEIKIPVFYKGQIENLRLTISKVADPKYLAADPNDVEIKDGLELKAINKIVLQSEGKNRYGYNRYPASFTLPTNDPGIYYLELSGDYLTPTHLLINITNYAMASQKDGQKNLIWVLNHNKKPASGATITSYEVKKVEDQINYTPKTLGTTNTQGVLYATELTNQNALIAQIGDEYVSLIKRGGRSIEPLVDFAPQEDFPIPNTPQKNTLSTFSYTEKPIYKPGDTINFKSIIRVRETGGYKVPAAGTKVKVLIGTYKNGEKKVYEKTLETNSYGSITDTFNVSSEVPTGSYYLKLTLENNDNQSSNEYDVFQVQAYKKDEYQINIDTAKTDFVDGETVKVTVDAKYFFGTPVKGETVDYKVTLGRTYNYPIPLRDDVFLQEYQATILPEPWNYRQQIIKEGSGTLNNDGTFSFEFPANTGGEQDSFYRTKTNYQALYQIEASVTDASNQPVSESKNITVHPTEFKMETKELTPLPEVDQEYKLQIKTLNHNNEAYSNAKLKVTVYNEFYQFRPIPMCDTFAKCIIPPYENHQKTTVVEEEEINTNSNGLATFKFTPSKPGRYQILVTGEDSGGRTLETSHYLHIYGEKDGDYYGNQYNNIVIQPEHELYKSGENIKLNVFSNSNNKYALVTVYKDQIINYHVVAMNNGKGSVTIKTTDLHAPSIGVCAIALNNEHSFTKTNRNLKVIPENKKLNISVTANKQKYLPGEKATFTVTAKDINNRPVSGEISFALVDKAIFNLISGSLDDIYYTFYKGDNYYNLEYIGSDRNEGNQPIYYDFGRGFGIEEDAVFEAMPVGAPMATAMPMMKNAAMADEASTTAGGASQPGLDQALRNIFKDTAYFNGQVILNSSGQATVTLDLPHNLTTWVGTAIGHTKDTKVGSGTGEVMTQKDLMLSSHLPRFVTEKDSIVFRTTVHNTNSNNELTVTLNSSGFTSDTTSQNITVAKGSSKTIEWPITVSDADTNKTITATFEVKENNGYKKDTLVAALPLKRVGTEKITSEAGEDSANISIIAETGDIKNIESLTLDLSPTLAENIIKSIEFLTGYPYGCVEQTMSKFLPNVVAYKHRNDLGIADSEIFDDMDKKVQTGLDRLYNYQHRDGGWGWWEDDLSNTKNTTYVMYGLTLAKDGGYEVDENVYNQGIEFLTGKIDDKKFRPYIQYVLSMAAKYNDEAGEQTKSFKYYSGELSSLTAADLSYLIMTEVNVHGSLKTSALKTALVNKVTTVDNMSHVNEQVIDYENMGSKELSTSLTIEALAKVDANNPLIPNMLRWLDTRKEGYVYHETHATAHAIIAIVEYVKNTVGSNPNYTYEVTLNGAVISSGRLDKFKTVEIPTSLLTQEGANSLKITKNGNGKLYYTFIQKEFLPKENLEAINNGITVSRKYFDNNGLKVSSINVGDIVRAEITIKSGTDLNYVIIEDKLPAGLEPVNTALKRDENTDYERLDYRYNDYVDHRDLLDDKTAMFRTRLPSGDYKISYYLRAVTPGNYSANPTMVYPMYAPEINGSSSSDKLTITQ